jgi:hypothetical protein
MLVLLELTFQYVQTARRISLASDDLTAKLFESVRFFAGSSHDALLQSGRKVTTKMLALAAAGVHFYARLAPFVKSRLVGIGANQDVVERHAAEATKNLQRSCQLFVEKSAEVLVKIIEAKCARPDIDPAAVSKYANEIAHEVLTLHRGVADSPPASLCNPIFGRIGAAISGACSRLAQGPREPLVQRDVDFLNSRLQVCPCAVRLDLGR